MRKLPRVSCNRCCLVDGFDEAASTFSVSRRRAGRWSRPTNARRRAALDERDNLLREAAKFYPGLSQREAARLIRIALLRYRDGRWRRDRSEATYPVQRQGKLTALLYALLRRRDAVPSAMTIRRAIAFRDPARVQSCGHHDAMEASNDI